MRIFSPCHFFIGAAHYLYGPGGEGVRLDQCVCVCGFFFAGRVEVEEEYRSDQGSKTGGCWAPGMRRIDCE